MSYAQRLAMLAAGTGMLSPIAVHAQDPIAKINQAVEMIVRRSAEANDALMRGDIATYRSRLDLSDDFVLMSPFGGFTQRKGQYSDEEWKSIGAFFKDGRLEQETVQTYASNDMVVLATVERARVNIGTLPSQDWALRVTQVYRREGDKWVLVHRHADPLANGISVPQAALITRGEAELQAKLKD